MTENHEFERGRDGRSTDIETGGGTPGWLASHLNFCSRCDRGSGLAPSTASTASGSSATRAVISSTSTLAWS